MVNYDQVWSTMVNGNRVQLRDWPAMVKNLLVHIDSHAEWFSEIDLKLIYIKININKTHKVLLNSTCIL